MNKSLYVIAVVAVVAAILALQGTLAARGTPECRDRLDNDNDTKVDWPNDAGCASRNDNDETNCGDGVCEGGETSSTCPQDCGVANTCGDTDGGIVAGTRGTISGTFNGQPYSATDFCLSATSLNEYYCNGANRAQTPLTCGGGSNGSNSSCVNGACI